MEGLEEEEWSLDEESECLMQLGNDRTILSKDVLMISLDNSHESNVLIKVMC